MVVSSSVASGNLKFSSKYSDRADASLYRGGVEFWNEIKSDELSLCLGLLTEKTNVDNDIYMDVGAGGSDSEMIDLFGYAGVRICSEKGMFSLTLRGGPYYNEFTLVDNNDQVTWRTAGLCLICAEPAMRLEICDESHIELFTSGYYGGGLTWIDEDISGFKDRKRSESLFGSRYGLETGLRLSVLNVTGAISYIIRRMDISSNLNHYHIEDSILEKNAKTTFQGVGFTLAIRF